jgi:hypothetical protein
MLLREDVVYEFERYSPFLKWGNSYPGHLLPTDKGRCSELFLLPPDVLFLAQLHAEYC